jgi:signal transduction histidine kinase
VRVGGKSLLLVVVGYAVLIAAFAVAIDRWLHLFEDAVTLETSNLLAREAAALLSERTLGALAAPDGTSRTLLRERIQDMTLLSEVVSSITVVDRDGKVVASDRRPSGGPAARPDLVFSKGWRPQLRPGSGPRFFQGGDFAVAVPLVEGGQLIGYVEVQFHSERVAGLFGAARRHFLFTAVAGLAGVLLLGGVLQFHFSRQAASIAETLEDAVPNPTERRGALLHGDEFSRALQAAGRVRQVLSAARQETSRLQVSFGALAKALKMGVLLLRRGGELDFANSRALELLGSPSLDDLKARWPTIREVIEAGLTGVEPGEGSSPALHFELPGPGVPRLRVETYRVGDEERGEHLVLLNDPEILDSLETDVRLASQLHGLARVYRTVAHELRAPLSAMMIHLDLLRESLAEAGAGGEAREDQERYVVVLREELGRLNRSLSEALTQTLPPVDQRDKFDLRDALAELGTLLAPQARRQGVELRTRMPDAPVVLVGYRDRLKQSFLNIAVNALEALPAGGLMKMDMETDVSQVTVRVSDTGPGIPAALLDRIYDRDFTTKGTGSGIGLYVARVLVEMHGGEIRVESREGLGTQVEVRLPIVARD